MVHQWVLEDLDLAASVCNMSVEDVFEDVLALLCSDAPQLHSVDPDYADSVGQVAEWLLEDVECVARSFGLDHDAVFADALEVIISDTHLADRIQEGRAVLVKSLVGS